MPDSKTHSELTRVALLIQDFDTGNNEKLIGDYSSWPDYYFSERSREILPYMFFLDGIQFHYPPDTPYNELYRYWFMDEKREFHRRRPFINENFRHVTAGFRFYIDHIFLHFQRNEQEEGKKYLGCLLHMLQDSVFGFHSLEGAGGCDAFVLDRLIDFSPSPSTILAGLRYREDFKIPDHTPRSLGRSRGEMVMKLYAAYCRAAADSRRCAFRYIMNTIENHPERNFSEEQRMFDNAVKLCSDTVYTLFRLEKHEKNPLGPCRLEDLEPFLFPFGGFGPYRFRSFLRDCAVGHEGKIMPLELDNTRYEHGISFGTHLDGALLYSIEPRIFREFHCRLGFHTSFPVNGEATVIWVNNGKEIETVTFDSTCRTANITIPNPENEFGLKIHSTPLCGVLVLADPVLVPETEQQLL